VAADAIICDYVRTPIGRYGGALASVRVDDLAALPIRELPRRHLGLAEAVGAAAAMRSGQGAAIALERI
jgi:acetyl-CoA acetyltransferase